MNSTEHYDSTTLNHWLWWKLKCAEAGGEEFQRLFEEVMTRTDPDFARIRPYGKSGDKKSDGALLAGETLYQVYSPEEFKQAKLVAKIQTDFVGAVHHWKTMKRWVFVYNVRRGLPPDVAIELIALQQAYPNVKLDHLSSDQLWERLRNIDVQRRAEVLGAPNGYEHFFLSSSSEDPSLATTGRFLLIHDMLSPIDQRAALEALRNAGGEAFGPPVRVSPSLANGWSAAANFQKAAVEVALERSRHLRPRFSVFCLSPIALAVHLGFVLSDRVEVETFQWDRDANSWHWKGGPYDPVHVVGLPENDASFEEAQIRISLSADVRREDCVEALGADCVDVEIRVDVPDVQWLRQGEQTADVARKFRETMARLRRRLPNLKRVHLFAAVPAGIAIGIGRTINPNMDPPIELYEYKRSQKPAYERVLTLQETSKCR